MPRKLQAPELTEDKSGMGETIETHPCYAVVGVHHVHGTPGSVCFGSDFRHHATIRLRIQRASLRRGLSHDWVHPTAGGRDARDVVEIEMTEAQWSSVISNPNRGEGLPCTLLSIGGQMVPGIDKPTDREQQFKDELLKKIKGLTNAIAEATEAVHDARMTQQSRGRILERLASVSQELKDNLPFVVSSAEEHIDQSKDRALIDIHAHMTRSLQALQARFGVAATQHVAQTLLDVNSVERPSVDPGGTMTAMDLALQLERVPFDTPVLMPDLRPVTSLVYDAANGRAIVSDDESGDSQP